MIYMLAKYIVFGILIFTGAILITKFIGRLSEKLGGGEKDESK